MRSLSLKIETTGCYFEVLESIKLIQGSETPKNINPIIGKPKSYSRASHLFCKHKCAVGDCILLKTHLVTTVPEKVGRETRGSAPNGLGLLPLSSNLPLQTKHKS